MAAIIFDTHKDGLCPDFLEGLNQLKAEELLAALAAFRLAIKHSIDDEYSSLYASYHGLVNARLGNPNGLRQCRLAAHFEQQHADVFLNLARVEVLEGNRTRALDALRSGLRLEPAHIVLRQMRKELGVRRSPCIGWLNRDHRINQALGRFTYWVTAFREGNIKDL
ncbi:MAG TPA: hypothetical protein ENI64_11955 [Gammaproteobacteria bacterium]|nr:hypothetical protein [Gammaproteobacteria bacterium]